MTLDEVDPQIIEQAIRVFGSEEEARDWLTRPAYGLEGRRLIDVLGTDEGSVQVDGKASFNNDEMTAFARRRYPILVGQGMNESRKKRF